MDRDTSEYSSTQAPETAEHAQEQEKDPVVDSRLIPGGAEPRSDTQQGIAGLEREDQGKGRNESSG
ncbi:MAG: hypothetical protein H0W53_01275 [Acidobacteria bacterium]|nr:hypothetical protein [Acidobacteriota bacterium]